MNWNRQILMGFLILTITSQPSYAHEYDSKRSIASGAVASGAGIWNTLMTPLTVSALVQNDESDQAIPAIVLEPAKGILLTTSGVLLIANGVAGGVLNIGQDAFGNTSKTIENFSGKVMEQSWGLKIFSLPSE